MTLHTDMRTILTDHMVASGLSMAALSRQAGVGEGTVGKIFREPAYVPSAAIVAALSKVLGITIPSPFATRARTWAQVREELRAADPSDPRVSRINWLMRSTGWVAETRIADRREVVEFFKSNRPATFDLAPSSYASYRSVLLSCVPKPTGRKRGIRDVVGPLRELYDAIGEEPEFRDYHLNSGTFLAWMDERGLAPCDLVPETLSLYFHDRLAEGDKSEKSTRTHVQRIATLTQRLAAHPVYSRREWPALPSPWERPEVLPGENQITPLLAEFDASVAPWLRGELSASGEPRKGFLVRLDAATAATEPDDPIAAALAKARASSGHPAESDDRVAEAMAAAGFLRVKDRWSEETVKSYRKQIRALSRRLFLQEAIAIPSISKLVDPKIVELLLLLTLKANPDEEGFGSDYAKSFAGRTLKLAEGYVGLDEDNLGELKALRSRFASKRTGIAPRNKAKLELFTESRTDRFCGLSGYLLRGIKREVAARRRRAREEGKSVALADLYDRGLACRVMQVIAHDLLLARAPRSANVIYARLEWIRWRDGCASLVVPAAKVKGRSAGDADLVVPLEEEASETLKVYIEQIRAKALRKGDAANPYLFPSPKKQGQAYAGLLKKLCDRVHDHVGARLTPHLYRHLMGWIWLRKDPAALPQVQRLLGHKTISTTMRYYADIADQVAIDLWQKFVTQEKNG